MNFQSVGRSSNFATAGNAAADDTLKSFLAARRNSPNYGKLAQEAASYKSAEKVATIKAEAAVEQAGIKAKAKVKADKIEIDAKSNYASAKRKAGAVGLAGKMFASVGTAGGDKPLEPYKGRSREELQGDFEIIIRNAGNHFIFGLFISSIIQFFLASMIVVSDPGESSFNEQVATMTWVSYLAVLVPTILIVGKGYWELIAGMEKITGLKKEDFLKA